MLDHFSDPNLDIQQKYLNRFQDLQTDLETKANENARLRYDFQFLKSEYAHNKEDYERKSYEQQQQYKTSLESLATERQELIVAKDVALTSAKKEVVKSKSEIQFNLQRIADLQEEIKTLVRDKTQLLEDFQASQRTHKHLEGSRNEELRKLELNNQSLESQLQATKQDLEKTRASLVIVQEKVAVEVRRSDDYESELRKSNNDFTSKNRDLEKAIKREKQHSQDLTRSFTEKIKAMEALLEAANAQRNEQRRLASEIEVKANKSIEQIKSKFQYEVNQVTSDRDQLSSDLLISNDKIEMLSTEKKEERKDFESQTNDLNEQVVELTFEIKKSREINSNLRAKAGTVSELEAQLHASKLQINEISKIYETFKNDAETREKKLVNERNEASADRVDAIKELSNERADINRNLSLLEEKHNRKNLRMLEDKQALELKLNDGKKSLSDVFNKNSRLKKREQKIKSTVTSKLDSYKKRLKKCDKIIEEQNVALSKARRLNGVPLEQFQKLEHELRSIKNKAKDLQHASHMWHLKMLGQPTPALPAPSLMTQMALNKLRTDQDNINVAVRNLTNTYHLDRPRFPLGASLPSSRPMQMPNSEGDLLTRNGAVTSPLGFRTRPLEPTFDANLRRFDSLTNYQVDGFTRPVAVPEPSCRHHGHLAHHHKKVRSSHHKRNAKSSKKLSIKDKNALNDISVSESTQIIESTTVIKDSYLNEEDEIELVADNESHTHMNGQESSLMDNSGESNDDEHIENLEKMIETHNSRRVKSKDVGRGSDMSVTSSSLDEQDFQEIVVEESRHGGYSNSDFDHSEPEKYIETSNVIKSNMTGIGATTEETSKILNELMDDSSELTGHGSEVDINRGKNNMKDETQELSLISTASIESASLDEI